MIRKVLQYLKQHPFYGGAGVLISIASLLFFIVSLFSKEQELVLFLLAYILFLGAVAVFVSPEKQSGTTYKDVNLLNFYFFCMLAPIAIITVVYNALLALTAPYGVVVVICWIIQLGFILAWFVYNIVKHENSDEDALAKLDFFSTIAIIPLTVVWVLYDISKIKVGFAFFLGEFMIIQALIKGVQIKKKDSSSNHNVA